MCGTIIVQSPAVSDEIDTKHELVFTDFCTVVVSEDGMEVYTLSLPWSELTSKVYTKINAKMNISQKYVLLHNGVVVTFDKHLNDLPETHPTMPLHLNLQRLDTIQDHRPSELGSRSSQRSGSRTVIEGAAYNGDDHVVYDDSVQACDQSSMTGESDAMLDSSDFAEGPSSQRQVPPTLALTGALADPGKGQADSERLNRSWGTCAFEDATKKDIEIEKSTVSAVISDEQFKLYEDNEHPEEDELLEEVSPGDIDDEADDEGSQNTDEENADDSGQENEHELSDEAGEALSDFRSTNMERQLSLEGKEDALFQGIGEEGGRDRDSDESVCGDSRTSSEENFSEDEGDAGNEESGDVAGPSSRNQPRISVDPEGSASESDDKVARDVDSEVNGSESDDKVTRDVDSEVNGSESDDKVSRDVDSEVMDL
ncbi:RNA polymerase-associated protein LEO1-like [Haliotis rubra]|uniref:RNA polymerase-associated protein LEO1-like n=1 Tax=Haliotis rubra TaxID=36100 RepID=UPI001EE50CD7|nr:RNA polymerase-associated protein LEO1-like [Haliotis rubra]